MSEFISSSVRLNCSCGNWADFEIFEKIDIILCRDQQKLMWNRHRQKKNIKRNIYDFRSDEYLHWIIENLWNRVHTVRYVYVEHCIHVPEKSSQISSYWHQMQSYMYAELKNSQKLFIVDIWTHLLFWISNFRFYPILLFF